MISFKRVLLGVATFHLKLITATTGGIFPTKNHDIDSEIFGSLGEITNNSPWRSKMHISDKNTFNIMDVDPVPIESSPGFFSDVYNNCKSAGSVPPSSLSNSIVVGNKGIQNAHDAYHPLLKECGWYEGLGVDQQAQYQSLPTVISLTKPRPSASHLEWKSRAKTMKGAKKTKQISPQTPNKDKPESLIHAKDQTGNRKFNKSTQVTTKLLFRELQEAKKDKLLHNQFVEARDKKYDTKAKESKAAEDLEKKIEDNRDAIVNAYRVPNRAEYRVTLTQFLPQPDSELEGKEIAIYPSYSRHGDKFPRDGIQETHNAYIKLLSTPSKTLPEATMKANRVLFRTKMIGHYLDYLQQFPEIFSKAQLQSKISDEDHEHLLEWFYNLVFKDTQDHPPLMGEVG
ncbi:hypothetical protein PTTG_27153 [Puccinia triticina 1-1 BBBD Race 1]|uniref:Uncharacterized protein n=1 Tax=Puccinia triticina (isolate 1-1 / race 1 (BBBD)) TaxID=630390 RepID=A0A180GNA7_PUCT1|nr:hypothetical protein PTTG_27153 [Puccinia triticina 1-1 BBBD Race 1]WAR53327.1 hypothetical protein PtB15_2B758 [Puccinia triticina]